MKCYVCGQEDWFLFDKSFTREIRATPDGKATVEVPNSEWDRTLGVCKACGCAAYQVEPTKESDLKEYYKKEYRGQIGPGNLITTTRKLTYYTNFIKDFMASLGDKKLMVGDVGCATGYIVNWFRQQGHKATGSEWTLTMRRFAEHFYGFPVTTELTPKHKYDLISMYHVFEHVTEPDKKLEKYIGMLAPGGHILISCPEWLTTCEEWGAGKVSTFKSLYHKDHINVFTRKSIQRLFRKFNLVIVKEDHLVYGQTYLLRPAKEGEKLPEVDLTEKWEDIKNKIEAQKAAIGHYQRAMTGKADTAFRDALLAYPLFPDAYYDWVLNSAQKKDRGRCAELIEESLKLMPGNVKLHIMRAYFLYQEGQWAPALDDFTYLCNTKPNEDIYMHKGYCLFHLGRLGEAMDAFNRAAIMNPQKWTEAQTWICKCATDMPNWEEVAEKKMKEQLMSQAGVKFEPVDPTLPQPTNGHKEENPATTPATI